MSSFNAVNGVPATANPLILHQILRKEWGFKGFVVSDYTAVHELIAHGFAADGADAAKRSITAGLDMEMISDDIYKNAPTLLLQKKSDIKQIDDAVRNILRVKFRLGLFDGRSQPVSGAPPEPTDATRALSKQAAEESVVLLKNEAQTLPLNKGIRKLAVIGALADSKADQLGTWANADPATSITPLASLRAKLGAENVYFAPGYPGFEWKEGAGSYDAQVRTYLQNKSEAGFSQALAAASKADEIVVFLGEVRDMSGEANSRSDIGLPQPQEALVEELAKLGKPMVGVIMAGRPLTFHSTAQKLNAILYAWHGGPMAGPAIADILMGDASPSGKLPVTFPRTVGQIPIYYDHLSTGRPVVPGPDADDHYRSRYIDLDSGPEYPFGFGLSYAHFTYSATQVSAGTLSKGGTVSVSAEIRNTSEVAADEVVQLYTRQLSASQARPVRELKGFQRIHLGPGETKNVVFTLTQADLAFVHDRESGFAEVTDPGQIQVWISPDSESGVPATFVIR
jgi:beta-glucosidase